MSGLRSDSISLGRSRKNALVIGGGLMETIPSSGSSGGGGSENGDPDGSKDEISQVIDKEEETSGIGEQREEQEAAPIVSEGDKSQLSGMAPKAEEEKEEELGDQSDEGEELDLFMETEPGSTMRQISNTMNCAPGTPNTPGGISFVARAASTSILPNNVAGGGGAVTLRHNSSASSITVRSKREIKNDPAVNVDEWKRRGSDAAQAVISSLYCKILIVFGLAFPMAEVIADTIPRSYFQFFYVYLFLGSLLFLMYIYIELMRVRAKVAVKKKKKIKNIQTWMGAIRKRITSNDLQACADSETPPDPNFDMDEERLIPRPKQIYGSFYIRMGAVLFGIGSMIYSGIEIGIFFEVGFHLEECKDMIVLVRPFLQMVFVFVQMYFIFLNHKMNIYKNKIVSRFGLMHMIATNICVWLNVLIMETHHEIVDLRKPNAKVNQTAVNIMSSEALEKLDGAGDDDHSYQHQEEIGHAYSCLHSKVMGRLLAESGPFLFPCTIEYSLISAAVLYMMWKNIVEEHDHYKKSRRRNKISFRMHLPIPPNPEEMARNQYSVDCSNANNGLFSGIFVMVFTIISLIVFFVLIHSENKDLHDAAITVASLTELTLYSLTTFAVIIGMMQIRTLWYDSAKKLELDNLLLVVAQTGVMIYSSFCIIGAFFQLTKHLTAFLSSLMTLVQTTLQTVFILDASNRFAYCAEQVKAKPGRQVVTFLLVCNLAMWAINTLETNRADSHPIQVKFYGGQWVWPIITHVSMPLAIFYRFHSTVCLCEIWTKTFKYKEYNFVE